MATGQELPIDINASAQDMAETLFGDIGLIDDARYFGDNQSSGIFTNGSVSEGVTPSESGVILSTGRAQDFTQSSGDPNRSGSTSTNTSGENNNALFNAISGSSASTFDASYLEVDFTPDTDVMSMQFTFASEEYPEFSGSIFNDVVGIWINGVVVESPVLDITRVNSVNQNENETLYTSNTGDDFNTEMDGFTVTLTVVIPVNEGELNTLTVGIADVGDASYDSNVLIAANSIQGEFIAQDDSVTVFGNVVKVADVLDNDGDGTGVMLITHINGQSVDPGDTVTLSSGHEITLLADGSLSIDGPDINPGDPVPDAVVFSYTAEQDGVSDTAFVTVETQVPCFAKGTMIRTPTGEVAIEHLNEGDLVETRDHGPQPIRWIGARRVAAEGRFAPIEIASGAFGGHGRLVVSPQHRILLTHWMAELMFGEQEILVAAKDLVNDLSVRRLPGGEISYYHLLFDRHEIVWSSGLLTESFLPGPQVMGGLDDAVRDEVLALFPEIDAGSNLGYGPSARLSLRPYEALAMAV